MKKLLKKLKKLGKKKLILLVIACLLVACVAGVGIHCVVYDISPKQLFEDMITPKEELIVGKWQNESNVAAYVFEEDGTYKNYFGIPNMPSEGKYTIDGNKIKLTNNSHSGSVVYKFSVNGDKLDLEPYMENDVESTDNTVHRYIKVDQISIKSLPDAIEEAIDEATTNE